MELTKYFNKEEISKMTFEQFVNTCQGACRNLGIDTAATYTALTGKKAEAEKPKIKEKTEIQTKE